MDWYPPHLVHSRDSFMPKRFNFVVLNLKLNHHAFAAGDENQNILPSQVCWEALGHSAFSVSIVELLTNKDTLI